MSHARKLRLLFLLIAMCSVFIITYEGNFLLVSDRGKCVYINFALFTPKLKHV